MAKHCPSRMDIWKMFDLISPTYDRMNRIMTLGCDRYWRGQLARFLPNELEISLLDCATGTGDQMISLMEKTPFIKEAHGIDLAAEMIRLGREKMQSKWYGKRVFFKEASALDLPYSHDRFDCATISFGIRNVTDVRLCLREMRRVLKPGGRALVLECSLPSNPLLRAGHLFYMRTLLPAIGSWISKNKQAYRYLNETVETFPSGEAFCQLMREEGFKSVRANPLTFGVVSIYQGDKE